MEKRPFAVMDGEWNGKFGPLSTQVTDFGPFHVGQ